jgi:multidrug resistance protein
MSVADQGSVLVALPDIEGHFGTDLATVQWVIVGYALAISVLLLPMGRLGDIVGRKEVYIGGFAIFVLAAAVAGFSPTLQVLIGAKVVQGIGSAMIQGNGMATIISAFPGAERGKAMGTHLSVVGTGVLAGPALGGFLVSALGWRSVFLLNVPVGLVTIAVTALIVERKAALSGERRWPKLLLGLAGSGPVRLVPVCLSAGDRQRPPGRVDVSGSAGGGLLRSSCWAFSSGGSCGPPPQCWSCGCSSES